MALKGAPESEPNEPLPTRRTPCSMATEDHLIVWPKEHGNAVAPIGYRKHDAGMLNLWLFVSWREVGRAHVGRLILPVEGSSFFGIPVGFLSPHLHQPHSSLPSINSTIMSAQNRNNNQAPPLTQDEKAFLTKHYGGEFKFLMTYQLSIHKEEDREEGRRILRAMMAADDTEDSDESNDFLAELEQDPTSHVADYKFTSDQLDFLKKHHGHSGNFMRCYGLKPWDDNDCDEAVSIVKAFMKDKK
jgi:hypothetical protein